MTIIRRQSDLIDIEIGDLTFSLKPFSYQERLEIASTITNQEGTFVENAAKATYISMKYAIKALKGAKLEDGSDYKLQFDENSHLSEDSISDILNLEINDKISIVLNNFGKGVPTKIVSPANGEEVEGVKIVQKTGVPKK